MYVHEILVNRFGGLSLPRKSVIRLIDRPDMTIAVSCGRKTIKQQQCYLTCCPVYKYVNVHVYEYMLMAHMA